MFMIIREPTTAGGAAVAMSVPPERSAKQVQAAIKKNMEKQKRRSNGPGGGSGDIQTATPTPPRHQRPKPPPPPPEDGETLDERLEEMMGGPQRREREGEKEAEPVDLLPIVDSVFGQDQMKEIILKASAVLKLLLR